MHIIIIFNEAPEDHNSLRKHIQEFLHAFHPKDQVWKEKLQSWPVTSKVGLIMYSENNLEVKLLLKNICLVIKQEKYFDIEVAIQSEVVFLTNKYRKELYASYGRHNKEKRIYHNHRKVFKVYCAPKFSNNLATHLLSTFSSDHELKYLTAGTQQLLSQTPEHALHNSPTEPSQIIWHIK